MAASINGVVNQLLIAEPQNYAAPGVMLDPAGLCFLTLRCQDDIQVPQIVEQLQSSVLGHGEGACSLQIGKGLFARTATRLTKDCVGVNVSNHQPQETTSTTEPL